MTLSRKSLLNRIRVERRRQDRLKAEGRFRYTCADLGLGNSERLAILLEEVGEVATEVLTFERRRLAYDSPPTTPDSLRTELIQVAAIALAWLESDCNSRPGERQDPVPGYTPLQSVEDRQ